MSKAFYKPVLLGLLLLGACAAPERPQPVDAVKPVSQETRRPNFVIIVADDLGFSDLGAFGGEIDTPNLDALALRGLRLTGFHTAPTCSPTRSMLLSGTTNHFAGFGNMAEMLAPNQVGQPNHEGYLREDIAALPEILSANGYDTILSRKWHLGVTPEQDPSARGFNRSFALLQGGHNHFGGDVAVDAGHMGASYRLHGEVVRALPEDFYSSDTFTDYLIGFLRESQSETTQSSPPFLALLTFTAPHWPLQARPEDIAKYHGRYEAGFEALREQRLARQKELGLIAEDVSPHPLVLETGYWDELDTDQKARAARDMEIYAAMVDRLDQNVGRLVATIDELGELDNTIFFFLSDNGAEGLDLELLKIPALQERIAKMDNSLENRGTQSSYVAYGPGWAQAATAPSSLYKAYATEGGTRVVSFVTGPEFGRAGEIEPEFLTVSDILPTILDLADIEAHNGDFEGRTVRPIRGKSWVPLLRGETDKIWQEDEPFALELFGSRQLRKGDWKLTDRGDGVWHLYNIARDPGEITDLSSDYPEKRTELEADWDRYAEEAGVIIPTGWGYRP